LFLNDKSILKKTASPGLASAYLPHPPFQFEIPAFESGKLVATGFKRQVRVASDQVQTPGKPVRITLELDTLQYGIDTSKADLIFIRAQLLDTNGNVVPTNDYKVTFSVLAQDAGLVCPAIQPVEAGIASALLRTEAPKNPVVIKVSLPSLGLTDQLIWQP
jgi:beta-galactosidase